jgi:phosphate transport system substrate-binding protein
MAVFMLGITGLATAKEPCNGLGVKGVKDVVDKIAKPFMEKNAGIAVETIEEKGDAAIKVIGKSEFGFTFGMVTRPLKDEEKKAYPDIKAFLFAKDGVAVIVNPANPVKGLTAAQIRDIYAGKITDWSAVGGQKGKITVLIREEGAGQRAALEKVVMGAEKVDAKKAKTFDKMGLMKDEVAKDSSSIGYILIGAVDAKVKALELDGKAPTLENLKAGIYPVEIPFYLITRGAAKGATKTFIDFVMSPEGQKLAEKEKVAPAAQKPKQ